MALVKEMYFRVISKGHFFFLFERNEDNNKKIQKITQKIKKCLEKPLTFN